MKNIKCSLNSKWKVIIVLIIITIGLYSCRKESDESGNIEMLKGKWNWVKSLGGLAGQTYTPESTGSTGMIEFANDSVYKEYRDGQIQYEIGYKLTLDKRSDYWFIDFNKQRSSFYVFSIDRHTLILNDYTSDAFENTYVR